jgi:hypothetical protein
LSAWSAKKAALIYVGIHAGRGSLDSSGIAQ